MQAVKALSKNQTMMAALRLEPMLTIGSISAQKQIFLNTQYLRIIVEETEPRKSGAE